jgi:hypothetical protein
MSCCDSDGFLTGRENRLHLTIYTDVNETDLEDISGKTFSAVIFNPADPTDVYARAIGSEQVVVDVEESIIELVFAADVFASATWDIANYMVDDITSEANPKPFLPPDEIRMSIVPTATVTTP